MKTMLKRKQEDELDANTFHSAASQWKQMLVPKEDILGRRRQLLKQLLGYIGEVWREDEHYDEDPQRDDEGQEKEVLSALNTFITPAVRRQGGRSCVHVDHNSPLIIILTAQSE